MKKVVKTKRKKIKFKLVSVKISGKQHQSLIRYCRVLRLTPNKLLRQALREFMERNAHRLPEPGPKVSRNQLDLFETRHKKPVQLSILDAIPDEVQVAEE